MIDNFHEEVTDVEVTGVEVTGVKVTDVLPTKQGFAFKWTFTKAASK